MRVVVLWVLLMLLTGCTHTYRFPVSEGETLNEAVAIRLSREVLTLYGEDIAQLEPVAAWDRSTSVLGRNTSNHNRGRIIWRRRGESKYAYSVSIERQGTVWVCSVGPTK